jgi:hypothetical protein
VCTDQIRGRNIGQGLHFAEQLRTAHPDFLAELRKPEILLRIMRFDDRAHFLEKHIFHFRGSIWFRACLRFRREYLLLVFQLQFPPQVHQVIRRYQ